MVRRSSSPISSSILLLVLLLLLASSIVESRGKGRLKRSDCQQKCTDRCSATSHQKPCMFFCLKCCNKCRCVPPGTAGNKEVCPCYNNWKTKRGGPKCP